MIAQIREFLAARGVLEVHTPLLAMATVTDPDVASIEVPGYGFLQTSPEYFLKRMLAAGVGDCYQLGAVFRADENGRHHNAEFTLLEWYRLGFDDRQLMAEVAALVDQVLGPATVTTLRYADLVPQLDRPRDQLDLEFALACEALSGRNFIIDYPADQAALAKLKANGYAARFEMVIDGMEIANGYWELTDPLEHRQRFIADQAQRQDRGLAAREIDESFLSAIEAGLPDCSGVALGVDRLVMLALGKTDITDVLTFRR